MATQLLSRIQWWEYDPTFKRTFPVPQYQYEVRHGALAKLTAVRSLLSEFKSQTENFYSPTKCKALTVRRRADNQLYAFLTIEAREFRYGLSVAVRVPRLALNAERLPLSFRYHHTTTHIKPSTSFSNLVRRLQTPAVVRPTMFSVKLPLSSIFNTVYAITPDDGLFPVKFVSYGVYYKNTPYILNPASMLLNLPDCDKTFELRQADFPQNNQD